MVCVISISKAARYLYCTHVLLYVIFSDAAFKTWFGARAMAAAEGKEIDSQGAVSFVVSFDNFPAKQVKLPKSLATRKQRQAKSTLTEEVLAEKQKKAEERRKVSFIYSAATIKILLYP